MTVGTDKTLDVSDGELSTSAAQKKAIIEGAGANVDIGDYSLTAKTLVSDIATGTAPLTVTSTTKVDNLHASEVTGNVTVGTDKTLDVSAGTLDLANGQITNAMLATITTAGKVQNNATTATNENTGSAIVARDISGNFSANDITATKFIGDVYASNGTSKIVSAGTNGADAQITGTLQTASQPNVTSVGTLPNVDIDGGAIDDTTIGGATPAAGKFTTLESKDSATIKSSTGNGIVIESVGNNTTTDKIEMKTDDTVRLSINVAGKTTVTNLEATTATVKGTLNVDEAVTLDSTLGVTGALSVNTINEKTTDTGVTIDGVELKDNNIIATDITGTLQTQDQPNVTSVGTLPNVDIDGGAIDDTTIGGATPAAGKFTTLESKDSATIKSSTGNGIVIESVGNNTTTDKIEMKTDDTVRLSINVAGKTTVTNLEATTATVKGTLNVDEAVTLDSTLEVTGDTISTSSTTGALTVSGGVGIAENLYVDGEIVHDNKGLLGNRKPFYMYQDKNDLENKTRLALSYNLLNFKNSSGTKTFEFDDVKDINDPDAPPTFTTTARTVFQNTEQYNQFYSRAAVIIEGGLYVKSETDYLSGVSVIAAMKVEGGVRIDKKLSVGSTASANGATLTSDDRLKHNEANITSGLATILQLTPEFYDKGPENNSDSWRKESGFIAQEVLQIPTLVHAVHYDDTEANKAAVAAGQDVPDGYFSLDYNSVFTHAVAAIKELKAEKDELFNYTVNLTNIVNQTNAEKDALSAQVANLTNIITQMNERLTALESA